VLAGIVAGALVEEAVCDIVSEDEALAKYLTCAASGVICAAGNPFWSRFRVAYPPASI